MGTPERDESTVEATRPDGGARDLLRATALVTVAVGAIGSLGLMLRVGHRAPGFLLVLFTGWVLSPFGALVLADRASKRWPASVRTTLHALMLMLTIGSVAIYGDVVRRPRSQPAFMFLVVPLVSWLLVLTVLPIAVLISRKQPRRGRPV